MMPIIIVEMQDSAFMNEYGAKQALNTFRRIGRWGTCSACPIDIQSHVVHPERCDYTDRSDHQLNIEDIVWQYMMWRRRNGL